MGKVKVKVFSRNGFGLGSLDTPPHTLPKKKGVCVAA